MQPGRPCHALKSAPLPDDGRGAVTEIPIAAVSARVQEILAMARPARPPAATVAGPVATPGSSSGFSAALAQARTTGNPSPTAVPAPSATGTDGVGTARITESDAEQTARLDAWMARRTPASPLVGLGREFVAAGRANGVDPRLLVAIAAQESALGTAGSGRAINNAFGWGPGIRFGSWGEGIHRIAQGLARGYLAEGRDTIPAIQAKWAPVGAVNDPAGINGGWAAGVSALYAELGGDPTGTVRTRG